MTPLNTMQTSDLHVSAAPVKFGYIAASASGANSMLDENGNTIVAIPNKRFRCLAYNFIANGTVNVKFQSVGTSTKDKTGLKYCVANVGISVPLCEVGIWQTDVGAAPSINLSGAVAIGGEFTYQEVG